MAARPFSGYQPEDEDELHQSQDADHYHDSKRAPTRAIFSDLNTAIDSIKSGSARERHRSGYQQPTTAQDEDAAIPLQDLDPVRDGNDQTEGPSQSRGAYLSQQIALDMETISIPSLDDHPRDGSQPENRNPFRRKATISSSLTRGYSSDVTSSNKGPWSKIRNSTAQASVQEGSTIVNIIRDYNGSDYESAGMSHRSRGRPTQSFDPHLSRLSDDSFLSQDDDRSRGPLFTQPHTGLPRSIGHNDLSSIDSASAGRFDFGASGAGSEYSFRSMQNDGHPSGLAAPDLESGHTRQPLEQALEHLRRSSSIYSSTDSKATVQPQPRENYVNTGENARSQLPSSISESVVDVDDETRRLAVPVLKYYDRTAIDPVWSPQSATDNLRVPVQIQARSGNSFNRELGTAGSGLTIHSDETEDWEHEDWETVGSLHEYACVRPGKRRFGVGQTTSSLADNSDADDGLSDEHEVTGFSSTDRIIQHPGNVNYRTDYGRLDLKNQKVPVMAPKYGGHKVNGYPADSLRTRQPPQYITPSPLSTSHQNPFISNPPEVMTSPKARLPTGMPKSRRPKNQVPLGNQGEGSMTDTSSSKYEPSKTKVAASRNPRQFLKSITSPFSTQDSLVVGLSGGEQTEPHNEWDFTSSFAKSNSIPGPNGHDVRVGLPSKEIARVGMPGSEAHQLARKQRDGFKEVPLYGGKNTGGETYQVAYESRSTLDSRNDFKYRSPLAAPRRDSVRALYTESQLGRFEVVNKPSGAVVRESQYSRDLEQYEREVERHAEFQGLKYRHQQCDREYEMRLQKYGNVVLVICIIVPPFQVLLPFLALGRLDSALFRYTHKELYAFTPGQKRWAWGACVAWVLVVLVAVLAGFVAKYRREAGQ